jgi:GrpB-like predicted nucleotidyltransferase (UPF0157 family)
VKKYVFKPYSDLFPKLFEREKQRLETVVSGALIEHIGSTAISGLGGKGIIDIAIAVPKKKMEFVKMQIESLGYEYGLSFNTDERFYFVAILPDPLEEKRRYHIHLTFFDSADWIGFIHFRDYLCGNPEALKEYARLKQMAAESVNEDGERYRKLKAPFFQKIKKRLTP